MSWKDHPIALTGGGFIAGFAAAIASALPLYNVAQQNSIDAKTKAIEERYASDKADIANVRTLKEQNQFYKTELAKVLTELYALSDKKPFSPSSPIPVGFDSLVAGAPTAIIRAIFPPEAINQTSDMYIVTLPDGFFRTVLIDTGEGKIRRASYFVDDTPSARQRLLAAATATFGKPTSTGNGHGDIAYRWEVGGKSVNVTGAQYSIYD